MGNSNKTPSHRNNPSIVMNIFFKRRVELKKSIAEKVCNPSLKDALLRIGGNNMRKVAWWQDGSAHGSDGAAARPDGLRLLVAELLELLHLAGVQGAPVFGLGRALLLLDAGRDLISGTPRHRLQLLQPRLLRLLPLPQQFRILPLLSFVRLHTSSFVRLDLFLRRRCRHCFFSCFLIRCFSSLILGLFSDNLYKV